MTMIIIGVDPGLIKTGWGIIEKNFNEIKYIASGVIKTPTTIEMGERLKNIYEKLDTIIKTYSPDEFAIEETFVNKNPISSLKLGQARGVAMLTASLNNISISEYSPNLIKKSVTGAGKAEKQQMVAMVHYIFPKVEIKLEDEADSLCVAICHCNHCNNY